MHAARAIQAKRSQRVARPRTPIASIPPPRPAKKPTRPQSPAESEESGFKTRSISRDNSTGSTGKGAKDKIEAVVWGKCFCFIGVLVTLIGLILLLVGMSGSFRAGPFVFGVFCTISGILILMFGICFIKASEHWPELNQGSRVGDVFVISKERRDSTSNDEMVKVITVPNAPRLELVNERKLETLEQGPPAVICKTTSENL